MESHRMFGSGGVVTILKSDGKVLEFPRRLKCCELLAAFPSHTICPAVAIVLKQQGKISLAPDSYLEAGRTYFLLAKASSKPQQFAISKKQIAKIMQEAAAGRPARPVLKRSESVKRSDPLPVRKPQEVGAAAPGRPARPVLKKSEAPLPVRKPQKPLPVPIPAAVKRAMSRQRFVNSLSTIPEVTPML